MNKTPRYYAKLGVLVYLRSIGYTLEEVGETLDVTRERVRQLEKIAKNEEISFQAPKCPACKRPF